jgi:hypothetical protein
VFSLDHGVTWSQPQSVADILSAANGLVRAGVVDPRNPNVSMRTGDILPEPAIDPATGRLFLAWQDARFNGGANDQVVISTSADPLGRTGTWTAPTLVSPKGDPAAFTPAVVVNHEGQVAVLFQDFRNIDNAPAPVLPTDTWVRVASGPSLDFDRETHVSRTFNILAARQAGGFFLGDYDSITASPKTGGFTALWVSTTVPTAAAPPSPTRRAPPPGVRTPPMRSRIACPAARMEVTARIDRPWGCRPDDPRMAYGLTARGELPVIRTGRLVRVPRAGLVR